MFDVIQSFLQLCPVEIELKSSYGQGFRRSICYNCPNFHPINPGSPNNATDFARTWWRLLQKRVMFTKLDIYDFNWQNKIPTAHIGCIYKYRNRLISVGLHRHLSGKKGAIVYLVFTFVSFQLPHSISSICRPWLPTVW